MRIKQVELEDIRSYDNESVNFDDGLMLLYGDNGAGKSSLLSSIFFGLYLSDVLSYIDDDINLDSIVRKTEDEGTVRLVFEIDGDEYEVAWSISVTEKNGERKASTKSCVLKGDAMDEPVEGVKAVRSTIEDLIGMSPESFVNSVYVQQGNISRVVEADGDDRKKIVDGLLGLSRLDTYIDRMDKARREIGAQKRSLEEVLKEKNRQINSMEDEQTLKENLERLQQEKSEAEHKKEKLQEKIESVREDKREIESKIEEYSELEQEYREAKNKLEELKDRRDELDEKKENVEAEADAIKSELEVTKSSLQEKCDSAGVEKDIDVVEQQLEELESRESEIEKEITTKEQGELNNISAEIERKKSEKESIKDSMSEKQSSIDRIEDDISDVESDIQEYEESIEKMREIEDMKTERIDTLCDKLNIEYDSLNHLQEEVIPEARDNTVERISEVHEELGMEKKELEYVEDLVKSGVCPVCGEGHQSVEEFGQHMDESRAEVEELQESIEAINSSQENLDELDKLVSSVRNVISKRENKESRLQDKRERLSSLESEKQDAEERLEELREELGDVESEIDSLTEDRNSLRSEVEELKESLDDVREDISLYEDILNLFETVEELEDEIQDKRDEADKYRELRKNVQSNFIEKKQEVENLSDEYEETDISNLREQKSDMESKIETGVSAIESAEEDISELQEDIAEKKQQLKRLRRLKERRADLEEQQVDIADQETDAEDVIGAYEQVKSILRQENLGLLNKYSNDVFKAMYDNRIYQRMEIDEDYDITLLTGDGVRVNPEDLSGGEMTLVSLAIRAGVYKLLVERQGSADTLPPFILDEPTTFLDEKHVSNLQNMIEKITSWDVPQVFIVSHREDMIQNADSAYKVEKDPSTETSSVEKQY